ncbi:response regulator transcription factor [Novosphingobium sp.]|uniref:response regulator n=1 Tax=Novosphingobium sp. TaxID=1874826 RepID=UPI002735FE0C|nr:response regulator transcription factor [Novosphingobium sp.]MDP3907815.1 response regulator transcription factor [Novosphingobium sp.]
MRVLLVEDDAELRRRLSDRLASSGLAVDCAATAADARDWPDLPQLGAIILDLGLPDGDGLDVLRGWRAQGHTVPVLILTARGDWRDKVDGLNSGADDFIVKPVRFEELMARLHALWRRGGGRSANSLVAGRIALDPVAQTATLGGQPLELSRKELTLLHLFVRRPGHVIAQDEILEQLYPLMAERDRNAVEAHISRLRRKIGRDTIRTVRGLGYRLEA